LIVAGDSRIGKLPGTRRASGRKSREGQESSRNTRKAKRIASLRSKK
jgi:hypothetical protein